MNELEKNIAGLKFLQTKISLERAGLMLGLIALDAKLNDFLFRLAMSSSITSLIITAILVINNQSVSQFILWGSIILIMVCLYRVKVDKQNVKKLGGIIDDVISSTFSEVIKVLDSEREGDYSIDIEHSISNECTVLISSVEDNVLYIQFNFRGGLIIPDIKIGCDI